MKPKCKPGRHVWLLTAEETATDWFQVPPDRPCQCGMNTVVSIVSEKEVPPEEDGEE